MLRLELQVVEDLKDREQISQMMRIVPHIIPRHKHGQLAMQPRMRTAARRAERPRTLRRVAVGGHTGEQVVQRSAHVDGRAKRTVTRVRRWGGVGGWGWR